MAKQPSAPKKDNTAVPQTNPESNAIKAADAEIVNNPAEGKPDLKTLPVQAGPLVLPAASAPIKRRQTLGSGTVREDR